jgi:hypothetical protein
MIRITVACLIGAMIALPIKALVTYKQFTPVTSNLSTPLRGYYFIDIMGH